MGEVKDIKETDTLDVLKEQCAGQLLEIDGYQKTIGSLLEDAKDLHQIINGLQATVSYLNRQIAKQ